MAPPGPTGFVFVPQELVLGPLLFHKYETKFDKSYQGKNKAVTTSKGRKAKTSLLESSSKSACITEHHRENY